MCIFFSLVHITHVYILSLGTYAFIIRIDSFISPVSELRSNSSVLHINNVNSEIDGRGRTDSRERYYPPPPAPPARPSARPLAHRSFAVSRWCRLVCLLASVRLRPAQNNRSLKSCGLTARKRSFFFVFVYVHECLFTYI